MSRLDYLHNHKEFKDLLRAVADEKGIAVDLVEKDYWIMQCLHGLTCQGYKFELKGGTSLSKGHRIIHRFSEDIDIRINPPEGAGVAVNPKQIKSKHCESRKQYYEQLAGEIKINGIVKIQRDTEFDDNKFRSGGIRLLYKEAYPISVGIKQGILLEVGFDVVTPNTEITISSWALEFAQKNNMQVKDNEADSVPCYHPGFTFVEKLQTIATKFRNQQDTGELPKNFMRHYYDAYCLLDNQTVLEFIGTEQYNNHKTARFPTKDLEVDIKENQAFILSNKKTREIYQKSYEGTASLYYQEQPTFDDVLEKIGSHLPFL